MLNLNSIMIGTKQLTTLAAFYEKILQKPADMVDDKNGFYGWQVGSASREAAQDVSHSPRDALPVFSG